MRMARMKEEEKGPLNVNPLGTGLEWEGRGEAQDLP